jgi:hypothetical protein
MGRDVGPNPFRRYSLLSKDFAEYLSFFPKKFSPGLFQEAAYPRSSPPYIENRLPFPAAGSVLLVHYEALCIFIEEVDAGHIEGNFDVVAGT